MHRTNPQITKDIQQLNIVINKEKEDIPNTNQIINTNNNSNNIFPTSQNLSNP
jgi:hypothetical protein